MPYRRSGIDPIRPIGVLLVSVYLYHWPLYNIFRQMGFSGAGQAEGAAPLPVYTAFAIAATVFLAEASSLAFGKRPTLNRAGLAFRRQSNRFSHVVVAGFLAAAAISALTLATAPVKADASEYGPHELAMQNIDRMEQFNAYLSGLDIDPVAMREEREDLPLMPSEVEALDIETDRRRTMEAARRASLRDGPDGPIAMIKPPEGVSITIIGDSVPLGASETLQETLGNVVIDAEVSRHMGFGAEIVEGYAERGELGDYVVITLFTNVHYFTEDATNETLEAVPPGHRVICVAPFGNRGLEEYARMVRDLPLYYDYVTVADWNAAIRDQNYLLSSDNIHMRGKDSCQIYANLISLAIEQAGRKPPKR